LLNDEERIDRTEMHTNAGLIVLNLWDRVDIFGTLGGTKFNMEGRADAFFAPIVSTSRIQVETDTDFSWSVGVRGVLWECGCTVIGVEAQYFRAKPDVRRVTLEASESVYPDDTTKFRYREWQVGLGIAHRINMFVPYFAVKWSQVDAKFENFAPEFFDVDPIDPKFDPRQNWGYAFGVTLVDCDIMTLNVEGRLRDERAVSVNAQIRF